MLLLKPLHLDSDNPMQHRRGKLMQAGIVTVYLCLPVLCTPLAASEPDGNMESADTAASDDAGKQEADPKQEDILDRVFSPLDNAVSDINRDLNKGDDTAAPDSSE
jgi:hypothetical protein